MTLAIIFACVIAGLVIWDQRFRSQATRDGGRSDPTVPRRTEQAAPPPRFKGNGTISPNTLRGPGGSPRRNQRARPEDRPRFSGAARREPNAIGVACGRPISECARGEDCLCLH
jgi:hypothetical protein